MSELIVNLKIINYELLSIMFSNVLTFKSFLDVMTVDVIYKCDTLDSLNIKNINHKLEPTLLTDD